MNVAKSFLGAVVAGVLLVGTFYVGRLTDRTEVVSKPGVPIIQKEDRLPPAAVIEFAPTPETTPERIIQYERVPEYRFLECPVPAQLEGGFRLTSTSPIEVGSDEVRFTWFNPDSLQFETRIYDVTPAKWGISGDLGLTQLAGRAYMDARLRGRYGRLSTSVGYTVEEGGRHGLVFGVRFTLFRLGNP